MWWVVSLAKTKHIAHWKILRHWDTDRLEPQAADAYNKSHRRAAMTIAAEVKWRDIETMIYWQVADCRLIDGICIGLAPVENESGFAFAFAFGLGYVKPSQMQSETRNPKPLRRAWSAFLIAIGDRRQQIAKRGTQQKINCGFMRLTIWNILDISKNWLGNRWRNHKTNHI